MLKREEKAIRKLIAGWNIGESLPYSSDPEFEDGIDRGRENCADELEYLLAELAKPINKAKEEVK